MVESVDTRDLKSLDHCGCAGSSPASSTQALFLFKIPDLPRHISGILVLDEYRV